MVKIELALSHSLNCLWKYTLVYTVPIRQMVFSDIVLDTLRCSQTVITGSWIEDMDIEIISWLLNSPLITFFLVVKDFDTCLWCTWALGLATSFRSSIIRPGPDSLSTTCSLLTLSVRIYLKSTLHWLKIGTHGESFMLRQS